MALSPSAVEDVVGRIRDQQSEVQSRRAVELRAVEPLLECLGWDVRSSDVEPDVAVAGQRVDYLLAVEGTPVVAVRTAAPGEPLEDEHVPALASVLDAGGLAWGLLSDGERYVLLARSGDDAHRQQLTLDELADATDALEHYTYEAASDHVARDAAGRADARERLDVRRDAAVEAVTDALVAVAGDAIEVPARAGAARLVEELAAGSDAGGGDAPGADSAPAGAAEGASTARRSHSSESATQDAADPPVRKQGEYVVRFFGGSSSVGAVGTDTPGATLVGVVGFLYENHDLGGAVQLPWSVTDRRATLAPAPEHPDGTPMEQFDVVDGDCYVWTGGPLELVRTAIEELADAVGLRVMFQGDW